MGYTFTIGNSVLTNDPEQDETDRVVIGMRLEHAPTFVNDNLTGKYNSRSPGYTVWNDFAFSTGLHSFFYDETNNLKAGHPGYVFITQADVDLVKDALDKYQAKAILPPGFEKPDHVGPDNYDYHLARLIWLEFWMRWAVDNCEFPAIQNT